MKLLEGTAEYMLLVEGTVAAPTNRSDFQTIAFSGESVKGAAINNVLPGAYTLILMRQQGQGGEVAAHSFQVSSAPVQELKLTPRWQPFAADAP